VGALVAPGLVLGGGVVMWLGGPDESEGKGREPRRVVAGGPATSPESPETPPVYPTFGQYVPPKSDKATAASRPKPKVTEKRPQPRETSPPKPQRTGPQPREICAEYGRRNPWLRHWCARYGHGDDRRDRD